MPPHTPRPSFQKTNLKWCTWLKYVLYMFFYLPLIFSLDISSMNVSKLQKLPEMVHSCNSIAQFQRTEVKRGLTTKFINPASYMCIIKCIAIYLFPLLRLGCDVKLSFWHRRCYSIVISVEGVSSPVTHSNIMLKIL